MEAVIGWQLVVFFSIALGGRYREGVVLFWVIWTLVQVFALWVSVLQFGTIWLAWTMFGSKGSGSAGTEKDKSKSPGSITHQYGKKFSELERLSQERFAVELELWKVRLTDLTDSRRWVPKGAIENFLATIPVPSLSGKFWRKVVGDATPEATARKLINEHNKNHVSQQRQIRKKFFDTVEKNPLTDEQILACICMDDAVMVVAAAGSGKTSAMVAKTGYVLHEALATPDQILLLAFNKATADEVGQRIATQLRGVPDVEHVRSQTFHAFGIDVIAKATGKKPSLASWVDPSNPGEDIREVSRIIQSLAGRDPSFKRDWEFFKTIYGRDIGKRGQHQDPDAYSGGKRGFLTANGEVVKSQEERLLADWLFYNGIAYCYERAYEIDTADANFSQYFPDFYYPDAQLYHEHFALDEKGAPPKHFKNYLDGVKWKRQIHKEHRTAFVETTSHGLRTGDSLAVLEQALRARGIHPVFDSNRKASGQAPVPERELARSFRVFQQHVKNSGMTHVQLVAAMDAQSRDGFGPRLRMYLSLYERISAEWEMRLKAWKCIDFEDMLVRATDLVESGAYKSNFTVILADEFQDSSRARIRLLNALRKQPEVQTHLCVVGDDWQGINRFAGADISVMTDFEKTFDHATRLTLNTTFRCPEDLCKVSSEFIQANPVQIKKKVLTTNPLTKTPMLAYGFQSTASIPAFVEQQLAEMHRYAKEGRLRPSSGAHITCMVLGRYRDDCPEGLERWKRQFQDHLKIEFRTVHSAKGLEAEYVFILNVVQGTRGFPSQIQDDPALQMAMPTPDDFPYAEERRLFYVGMTRSKKQIRFYTSLRHPSQFLLELVKKGHLAIESVDGTVPEACPQCGQGVLLKRTGQYGDFEACGRFPSCDFKRKIAQGDQRRQAVEPQRVRTHAANGDACPMCRTGILQRRDGRNGAFLGCSRYWVGCKGTANIQ